MIRLEVKDYCHNCHCFIAAVEDMRLMEDGYGNIIYCGDTIVRCRERDRCECIEKYLREECKNEKDC